MQAFPRHLDEACDRNFVVEGRQEQEQWMGDFEEGPFEVEIVAVGEMREALQTRMGACRSSV